MRIMRRLIFALFSIPVLYVTAALVGGLLPGKTAEVPDTLGENRTILLMAGPIHYDILLPLDDLTRASFRSLQTQGIDVMDPKSHWLMVGWGAKDFYTTTGGYSDLSISTVWRGIAGDRSVLRVDTLGAFSTNHVFPTLALSDGQYRTLLQAIDESFERASDGQLIGLDVPGFTSTDMFYAANGHFNIFRTCNTWISTMLRTSGVRFGAWTPTPYSVTLSLRWFHDL